MKKLFTLLLVIFAAISINAAVNGTFSNGGTWKVNDQGVLYIQATAIPDFRWWSSLGVTSTAPWVSFGDYIKEVQIDGATYIGRCAFASLSNLKRVVIAGVSQVTIGEHAFNNCSSLTDVDGFQYITRIERGAFWGCPLKNVVLPKVTYLDSFVFGNDDESNAHADVGYGKYTVMITNSTLPTFDDINYLLFDRGARLIVPASLKSQIDALWDADAHDPQTQRMSREFQMQEICVGGLLNQNNSRNFWMLNDDGTLWVVGTMPDFANASDAPWYSLRSQIKTVIVDIASKIGNNAFRGYPYLTKVIAENISTVGDYAFSNCSQLKNADIQNVKTIGKNAFENCTALQTINLRNEITSIDDNAFSGSGLKSVYFGQSLQSIGNNAFATSALNNGDIYVNGSCPQTSSSAFSSVSCSTVTLHVSIDYADGYKANNVWKQFQQDKIVSFPVKNATWEINQIGTLTIIGSIPNYANESDQPWYPYRDYIRNIVIRNGITSIGNNAFAFEDEGESQIKEVEIPATVETIGENAFKNNDQIEVVEAEGVKNIGDEAFTNCSSLEKVKFGKDVQSLGNKVFNQCGLVDVMAVKAAVPPAVTAQTFQGLGIVSSNAPAKVKAKAAARRAPNATAATGQKATTLEVPDDYLAKYLAAQYWNLFSFEFIGEHGGIVKSGQYFDGVWVIYEDGTLIASSESSTGTIDGFYNQPGVKRVELMGGATELNWGGFGPADLPNLEEVVLSPALHKLGDEVFQNSTKLKSINLENVDSIGQRAFKGCTSLTSVNLPAVKYIANNAFEGCTALTSATLSGESFKMDYQVFKGCTSLKSIDLSGMSSLSTPTGAFSGCTALRHVKMDGTASAVSTSMFNGCSALTTVELGSDCRNVYATAFANTSLDHIYSASPTPAAIEATAFTGLTLSDITAYVPADYVRIYKKADIWKEMNIVADSAYGEPMLPVGGLMNTNAGNCLWLLESDGTMTFMGEGECSTTGAVMAQHHQYAIYMENIIYTDEITSIGSDITSQYANYQYVKSVEIGADVKQIYQNAMLYPHVTDVYCFAADVPALNANAFNKTALIANDATLHVVEFPGTLAKYQASSAWNWFPHIVADLPTRKAGTVRAQGVSVQPSFKSLPVGSAELGTKTIQLTAAVYPDYATDQTISWSSSDNTVATVDANGLVTILGYPTDGEVTITATAKDGSNKKGTSRLMVYDPNDTGGRVNVESMEIDRHSVTLMESAEPLSLYISYTPANATADMHITQTEPDVVNITELCDENLNPTGEFLIYPAQPGTTIVTFTAVYFDAGTHSSAPAVSLTVHVNADVIFTENSKEGVPVTYRAFDLATKSCELYGKVEYLAEPDPVTGNMEIYHTAIDAATTGTVTIPSTVRGYNVVGTGAYALRNCTAIEEVNFCNGLRYVGEMAFDGCSALKTLRLPASVKELGSTCATALEALEDVHLLAPTAPTAVNGGTVEDTYAFDGLENATLHVAAGCRNIYNVAPWNVWFSSIVEDGEAVDNNVASYVCDFTTAASKHSNYNDAWTYDTDWTVYGGANNNGGWNYAKFGGKSATLANANPVYVANKYRFGRAIQGVRVTYPAGSFSKSGMSANDWGVKVYSDLACTNLLYTVTGEAITAQGGTLTVRPEAGQVWKAGYGIQVYWDLANTSSTNGIVLVDKIEYLTDAEDSNPLWNTYTVRFLNWDGTVLQESDVREGFMPEYTGETPVRPMDTQFIYTFSEWSPAIVAATADADYTAQYSTEERFPNSGTGIEDLFAEPDAPSALKVLHNGTLYILRPDGTIFNAQGTRVK